MTNQTSYEYFRNLFCKSKFSQLIAESDEQNVQHLSSEEQIDLIALRANSFYELNQIDESIKSLNTIIQQMSKTHSDLHLFYMGRLAYIDYSWDQACEIFNTVYNATQNLKTKIKAGLGLANVYLSLYQKEQTHGKELSSLMTQLESYSTVMDDQNKLSYLILVGNYQRVQNSATLDQVIDHFHTALKIASQNEWNYYQCRVLYAIAVAYEKFGKIDQMNTTLGILKHMIQEKEQVFFANIVNIAFERYKFQISIPVEFDDKNQRIKFNENWILLHERPLLYKFIETIYKDSDYVTKDSVAKVLWPDQEYKPRIHDPRIFDLAKRTRQILKKQKEANLALLSNRQGYRLGNNIYQMQKAG